MRMITKLILKIKLFFDLLDREPCYKEQLGYRCQHRVYKNGQKECQ